MDIREKIARRVAKELNDGAVVNLGIGLPTMVANYVEPGMEVTFQSENGMLGLGPAPAPEDIDPKIVNAGAQPTTIVPGGMFFDSATSFGFIRGGHVDFTILGALQVDQEGMLANWIIPGKMVPGMGGAMDLVTGSKKVIVAMQHNLKNDGHKILEKCNLPLTSVRKVDLIVTELGVFTVGQGGLVVEEMSRDITKEELQRLTGAKLIFPENIGVLEERI